MRQNYFKQKQTANADSRYNMMRHWNIPYNREKYWQKKNTEYT